MTNAVDRLRVIQASADEWAMGARESHEVSCQVACAACCTHLVPTTLPEATAALSAAMAQHPKLMMARQQKVKDDHNKLANLVKKHDGDAAEIEKAWKRQKVPCVFLGAGKRCLVYGSRPVACRTHLVVSEPDECFGSGDVEAVDPGPCFTFELLGLSSDIGVSGGIKLMQHLLPRAWNVLLGEDTRDADNCPDG